MPNQNNNSNSILSNYSGAKFSGAIFCFLMVFYVFITFIGQFILSALSVNVQSTIYMAISGCFSIVAIILMLITSYLGKRQELRPMLSINKCKFNWYILSILLFVGMFFALGFANVIFTDFLNKIFNIPPNKMGENFTLNRYIALSISLAVLPAIFEELFFRGILLNSLISGGKLFAVIVSSLCFAVYHCSITQLLYQFIFGIAFSLLALNSKSIFPCILTHFLNNFIILTAYYFKIENVIFNTISVVIGFICLALFIVFIIIKSYKNKLFNREKSKEKKELINFLNPFGIGAFIICLSLIILSIV